MSRWGDLFSSLLSGTPETPDDTCQPCELKPAQVSRGVTGVTPIERENKRETAALKGETAPDPIAVAAERTPVIKITDADAAADFRSQAILEPTSEKPCATVHRLREPSWSDARNEPRSGDRCYCCRGSEWWIEGGPVKRGWRCARCYPPPVPFVRQVRT